MQKWQVRVAPSLGAGFAGTAEDAWGCLPYKSEFLPTVFFGMYGMQDVQAYHLHNGEKAILWAGSDIRNLNNGYWLDKTGRYRLMDIPECLITAHHYVENQMERIALSGAGIPIDFIAVIPSFLGNIEDYPVQKTKPNKYYSSVSGDDFELYGWDEIGQWAEAYPDIEFHLYGNKKPWIPAHENVIVHGRVTQEEMDEQTKTMTGAIRLTRFDGFSEILAKSILWGQKPVSPYIYYPGVARSLEDRTSPDRDAWIKSLNNYPWYAKDN